MLKIPSHQFAGWLRLSALSICLPLLVAAEPPAEPNNANRDAAPAPEQRTTEQRIAALEEDLKDVQRQTTGRDRSAEALANQSRPLLEEALRVAEDEPAMSLSDRSKWNHVCHVTIALMRHEDMRSPQQWAQLHQRLIEMTPKVEQDEKVQTKETREQESARRMHEALCRKTLVMLLHRLPPGYALDELKVAQEQMAEEEDPRALGAWLYDLRIYAPPSAKGDAFGLPIDPQVRDATARVMIDLVQDQRIDYRRRRGLLMALASTRHSSGLSSQAGRMIDTWRERYPEEVAKDVELTWLRFNIALFGDADREAAGKWLGELQRIVNDLPEGHQAATLFSHASRHYFRLLPLGRAEYESQMIDVERNYLERRQKELAAHIAERQNAAARANRP